MKYKYLLIVLLLFIFNQNVTAQCTTCNITVTVPSSANITTIADGQTICFKGSGSYTGTLEFGLKNNHTICIGDSVIFNPSAIQNPGGGSPGTKFYNNGNWITSLSLGSNVDLVNYGVITTNSFNLTGGNIINNYGVITTTNAGEYVNINTGSSFISHAGSLTTFAGFLSLGSGGDFKVGGIVNVKKDLTNNSGATIPGIPPACAGLNVTGSFLNNGTVGSDGSNPAFGGIIANKTQTSGSGNFFGSTNVINPTITSNPTNQTTCPAKNAIFSVSATGPNLSYQWQRKTPTGYINVVNGGFYSGATTNQLQVTGANSTMDNLEFRVMVMACPFPIYSNYARLIVKPLPGATISPTNVTISSSSHQPEQRLFEMSQCRTEVWMWVMSLAKRLVKCSILQKRNKNDCNSQDTV